MKLWRVLLAVLWVGGLAACGDNEATTPGDEDAMQAEVSPDVAAGDEGVTTDLPGEEAAVEVVVEVAVEGAVEVVEETAVGDVGPEAFEWEVAATPGCVNGFCAASATEAPDPMEWGPYPVGIKTVVFYDNTRLKDGKPRMLKTEVWYPATDAALQMTKFRYDVKADAPPAVQEKIGDYDVGSFEVNGYYGAPVRHGEGRYPLVMFSHGAFGVRYQSITYTIQLASHGYVVVSPDHEGNVLYDLLLNGYQSTGLGDSAYDRPFDIRFLMDRMAEWDGDPANEFYKTIQNDNVGITGHSFGGYTCYAATFHPLTPDGDPQMDPRIKVIVPQAPAAYLAGAVGIYLPDWHLPTLMEGGELDDTLGFDQAFMTPWAEEGTPKWFLDIKRGGHFTFSDLCRLDLLGAAEHLGFDDAAHALHDGCGEMNWDWKSASKAINLYSIAMFNRYLRGSELSAKYLTAEAGAQFGNEIEWFSILTDQQQAALQADIPFVADRPAEVSPEVVEPSSEVIETVSPDVLDAEGYCAEC